MSCDYESRTRLEGNRIALEATGNVLGFERSGLTYYAKSGATTTTGTCAAITAMPAGLRFTLDNGNGSDAMLITPSGGTAITVALGSVYDFYKTAATGELLAVQLSTYPQ